MQAHPPCQMPLSSHCSPACLLTPSLQDQPLLHPLHLMLLPAQKNLLLHLLLLLLMLGC